METFSITVVSPEEKLYHGAASELVIPAKEGAMTILPKHAPMLAALKKGKLKIINNSSQKELLKVDGGFVEVSKKALRRIVTIVAL